MQEIRKKDLLWDKKRPQRTYIEVCPFQNPKKTKTKLNKIKKRKKENDENTLFNQIF